MYESITFGGTVTKIVAESFELKVDEGQIPFENLTLNSSSNAIGGQRITDGSIISVRDTGEIVLEDGTLDNVGEIAFLVLDTSADENDNIDLEGATGITP